MTTPNAWAADVPVSMPEPVPHPGLVPMNGFVFTEFGLYHDITEAEHEQISRPTFAPPVTDVTVIDSD